MILDEWEKQGNQCNSAQDAVNNFLKTASKLTSIEENSELSSGTWVIVHIELKSTTPWTKYPTLKHSLKTKHLRWEQLWGDNATKCCSGSRQFEQQKQHEHHSQHAAHEHHAKVVDGDDDGDGDDNDGGDGGDDGDGERTANEHHPQHLHQRWTWSTVN